MKHKHYDCIVAWAEGKDIEWQYKYYDIDLGHDVFSKWNLMDKNSTINWNGNLLFRIKKEPVIEVKYYEYVGEFKYLKVIPHLTAWDLKITYQDGKAIKAELPE